MDVNTIGSAPTHEILGGDPPEEFDLSGDRGDSYVVDENEQEIVTPAEPEPPETPEVEEEPPETPPETPEVEPEAPPKPDNRIPKARFDEVNEARKQLQRELEELKASQARLAEASTYDFDAREQAYIDAINDGNTDQAKAIRREIRQAELAIAEARAEQVATSTKAQIRIQAEFDAAVATVESTYPAFDPRDKEAYSQELVDMVSSVYDGLVASGKYSEGIALRTAADMVAASHGLTARGAETPVAAPAGSAKPTAAQVQAKLDKATRHPPQQGGTPQSQGIPRATDLTDDEFDALPKETLKRMRGDIY